MDIKPNDIVLCTVDRIVGTSVFVKIEGNGEGSIVTSEIAPGRIRNLRDYVVPNKKIVCKVLEVQSGNVHLSLRRVTAKEKKEITEEYEKEKNAETAIKIAAKDKAQEIIEKIKPRLISQFLNEAKENPKILAPLMNSEESERLLKILREKKDKQIGTRKNFTLKCLEPNAIELIKKTLEIKDANTKISYLAASRFSIETKSSDFKEANSILNRHLEEIEKKCKENKCQLGVEK
jgi:translation initiation factor 2 alpha subunit (eIF-2alpha)